jgi:hypothetical protein
MQAAVEVADTATAEIEAKVTWRRKLLSGMRIWRYRAAFSLDTLLART